MIPFVVIMLLTVVSVSFSEIQQDNSRGAQIILQIARPSSWCPTNIGNSTNCFDLRPSGYSCVCYVERFMSFPLAHSFCQSNGMHLVALQSLAKKEFLFQLKKDKNIGNFPYLHWWWSSGSDLAEEGNWVWTSTGEPFAFFDWGIIQPDGWRWQNNLALFNSNFKFFDWPSSWPAFPICEN